MRVGQHLQLQHFASNGLSSSGGRVPFSSSPVGLPTASVIWTESVLCLAVQVIKPAVGVLYFAFAVFTLV